VNVEKLSLLGTRLSYLASSPGGAMIYLVYPELPPQAGPLPAPYRAVEFIKAHIKLDGAAAASVAEQQGAFVEICTQYAQKGMLKHFHRGFSSRTLSFSFIEPFFFHWVSEWSIATFGFISSNPSMANAGGAWDNAKEKSSKSR